MIRAFIFKKMLLMLERYQSDLFQRIQMQILLHATAAAFGRPEERIWHLTGPTALARYAQYTKECMESGHADRRRLFSISYDLGKRVRRLSGLTRREDLQRLVFLLYRNIGITMNGQLPGGICIPACYFSNLYTPAQCRLISAMDAGIICGICGRGRLQFSQRLTEGCSCCRACLEINNGRIFYE